MFLEPFIYKFRRNYGEESLSDEFIKLMKESLSSDFFLKTGIDSKKEKEKIFMTQSNIYKGFSAESDNLAFIRAKVGIILTVTSVIIKWKSKRGSNITPASKNIEQEDIEMWFDNLDVKWLQDQYKRVNKRKPVLPFETSNYHFDIEVDFFFNDSHYLQVYPKNSSILDFRNIEQVFDDAIKDYNEISERKDRVLGLIHNGETRRREIEFIEFYLDLGSAADLGLKRILDDLNTLDYVGKVVITSFP